MFITKECDYGVRIVRILSDSSKKTVLDISDAEDIPTKFAYKILKKLEKANIVRSYRGIHGGYELTKPLDTFTLYDVFLAIDKELSLTECTNCDYKCSRNSLEQPCQVHQELCRIQTILFEELSSKTMKEILELSS